MSGLTNRVTAIFVAGLFAMGGAVMGSAPVGAATSTTTTTDKGTTTIQKPKPKKNPPPKPKLPTPHIGQVAKDGNFAFTVTTVQCGITTLDNEPFTTTAPTGSQWCLANMRVKDIKSDSRSFSVSSQYAYDGKNRKLDADTGSLLYIPNGTSELSQDVNPGVTIIVTLPFQLPTTSTIKKFELHDSAFSDGVTVWNVK